MARCFWKGLWFRLKTQGVESAEARETKLNGGISGSPESVKEPLPPHHPLGFVLFFLPPPPPPPNPPGHWAAVPVACEQLFKPRASVLQVLSSLLVLVQKELVCVEHGKDCEMRGALFPGTFKFLWHWVGWYRSSQEEPMMQCLPAIRG